MVNGRLPKRSLAKKWRHGPCGPCAFAREPHGRTLLRSSQRMGGAASDVIVQILGKFYFVNLLENLWRILFDYGQKLRYPANAAFKAAC
jgi:hypothetical protein